MLDCEKTTHQLFLLLLSLLFLSGCFGVEENNEVNQKHLLIFDGNTGFPTLSTHSLDEGESITLPLPKKEKYVFQNWNENKDGSGDGYLASSQFVMQDHNVTLYAQWKTHYILDYDLHGGSGDFERSSILEGEQLILSQTPVRDNYQFDGWNTESNGSGDFYPINSTFEMPKKDVILHAIWQPYYTLSYDLVGGDGDFESESLLAGEKRQLNNTPTLENYKFNGWNTNSDGSGDLYPVGSTFEMPSSDVTLYATWQPYYTLSYDLVGGDGDFESESLLAGEKRQLNNTPTLENHKFNGWNTNSDGSGDLYPEGSTFEMPSNDVTLYATWLAYHTLSYNLAGGQGDFVSESLLVGDQVKLDKAPTFNNYEFYGWNTSSDGSGDFYPLNSTFEMPDHPVQLHAEWKPLVRYMLSGNNSVDEAYYPGEEVTIHLVPELADHSFKHWNTDNTGNGKSYYITNQFTMPSEPMLLYPQWIPNDQLVKRWLSAVDGAKRISYITIPGSHDSGALYNPPLWLLPNTAKTQDYDIDKQLDFGVRFLDLRFKLKGSTFHIYHGVVDQKQTAGTAFKKMYNFLDANPTEFIIASVKEEGNPENPSISFGEALSNYISLGPEYWHTETNIPNIDEVRGKIVLLSRNGSVSSTVGGLDFTDGWKNNDVSTSVGGKHYVQDRYEVNNDDGRILKWQLITDAITHAQDNYTNNMVLNFTSGYSAGSNGGGIPNIESAASYINPRLLTYFQNGTFEPEKRYGTIISDYVEPITTCYIFSVNLYQDGKC